MEPDGSTSKIESAPAAQENAGSIDAVVARLTLWARRAPKGLALVEFQSEYSRRVAQDRLERNLLQIDIAHGVIYLQPGNSGIEVIKDWLSQLNELDSSKSVVTVLGFAGVFSNEQVFDESLKLLNFNRENLTRYGLRQIWWMPKSFAEALYKFAPDLCSWFILSAEITEQIEDSNIENGWLFSDPELNMTLDEVNQHAIWMRERITNAISAGATEAEPLIGFAIAGVSRYLSINEESQAHLKSQEFAQQIIEGVGHAEQDELASFIYDGANMFLLLVEEQGAVTQMRFRWHDMELEALSYLDSKNYEKAEPLLRRVLKLQNSTLGTEHLEVAKTANNLAASLCAQGRFEEGALMMERTYKTRQIILGQEHPATLSSKMNYGVALAGLRQYAQAELLFYQVLSTYENDLGENHLDLRMVLLNLAKLMNDTGRIEEAEVLRQRVQSIEALHSIPKTPFRPPTFSNGD